MTRLDGLWFENSDAWSFYRVLSGRFVRDGHLESWLLDRWTHGWTWERVMALIDRLDLIASLMEPDGRPEDQYRR